MDSPLINSGPVYGTYIHGIFDAPGIADTILTAICRKKGLSFDMIRAFDPQKHKEQQYDLLAETVRKSMDMEFVRRVLDRKA